MHYHLPDLPYSHDALLPVLSSRTMELHHGTHHSGYVRNANATLDKIRDLPTDSDPTPLLRKLAFHVSGHVMHSLFWTNLTPYGKGLPNGALLAAIERDLGGLDHLRAQLTAAITHMEGSGWAMLAWESTAQRLLVTQIRDHQLDSIPGAVPLLVIDGWEHAYYLDYTANRSRWAGACWDIIDWPEVSARFHRAESLQLTGSGLLAP